MFADPGYLGKPRLPLDTRAEVLAAWASIKYEAAGYNPTQRETIKARIRRAAHEQGVELDVVSKSQARRIFAMDTEVEAEDVDVTEEAEQAVLGHTGCMVALYPGDGVAGRIALDGGEPASELHVTLAYLGQADGLDLDRLKAVVAGFAEGAVPLTGEISGLGVFTADPEAVVTYASVDLPGLPAFRQRLVETLVETSFPVANNHGYTPHMTLAYEDRRDITVENLPLEFDQIWIVAAGERFAFDLRGDEAPYVESVGPAEPAWTDALLEAAKRFGLSREGAADQPAGYIKETELIHQRRKKEGAVPHDFQPAKWTHPNGHPRCALCCNEEPVGGHCPGAEVDDMQHEAVKESLKPAPAESASDVTLALPYELSVMLAPYKIVKRNGKICVVNNANEVKATFDDSKLTAEENHAKAVDYLRALYANVPGAAKKAEGTKWTGKDRAPEKSEEVEPEVAFTKAFLTEVAGKTILTAPVETLKAEHFGANPHYLWLEGAFVGAEEPNRNNAFWSTADLEFGELTVKNGPLNWLHEARHVIGSIVDGRLVQPTEAASDAAATVPHIRATAAMWKWIYPDEAQVIEFAAEVGKLFYSMECISESIRCAGDNGCGEEFAYSAAMRGNACDHIKEHASVRHLVKPTFLGGAVIVPPVRPGWAHADAHILRQASQLAESAYDQAGRPDIEASVWEQLMAEVVSFAQN